MPLNKYNKKRNFKITTEPKGKVKKARSRQMLFVVQKHAASHLHYDFRLELNGVLLSWAVPKGPCLDPSVKRLAVHVEDHPLDYGNFEGNIPQGQYGGGAVMLWDQGEWIPEDDDPEAAYKKGKLTFTLKAQKLKGLWKLIRTSRDNKHWLLMKSNDRYAKNLADYDITQKKPNSVKTKRNIDQISQNRESSNRSKTRQKSQPPTRMPVTISPQLAVLVDEPPKGKQWLHEIKFDGYRIIAFKKNHKTKLVTRNHNDWTKKIPDIAKIINEAPVANLIMDGELVILDKNNHSNFQLLQNAFKGDKESPFIYYVFDLLYYDNHNLMSLPLLERKAFLKKIVNKIDNPQIQYSDHIIGSGDKIFNKSCKLGLEGIVSKEAQSVYHQKRAANWVKVKCIQRQEFVIGGFTPPKNSRSYFGSLLLGTFNKKHELLYHGNVGTGFTEATLKSIYQKLKKYETKKMPFKETPPASKHVHWVKPILVCEVEFTEWTQDNSLRHPSFKGLRTDKPAKQIKEEVTMPVKSTIKLTNPDKILYKEDKIDKQQLVEYYQAIHKWILPYVINRPLSLLRCPDGYQSCFYQKHLTDKQSTGLYPVAIKEKHKSEIYSYIKDEDGLLMLPQLGVLEIHPWGSTVKDIENPDILIFDIDPAPNMPWKKIVAAAINLKEILEQVKLRSFVKSTGGKGLHVVVPIKPEYDWETIKTFSHTLVKYMMMEQPDKYVINMSKNKRTGKIFLDYLRNQRGATAVAPYSTRALIHAPIATPLHWGELSNDKRDTIFTIKTIQERLDNLKEDPWKDFFKIKQSLRIKDLV